MNLPREILDLIFGPLSRRDLWATSLTSRSWNESVSPILYETVIIPLWCGISLPARFIRSFVAVTHHSKALLIKNVVLLAEIENHAAPEIWGEGTAAMVNELMHCFLLKLENARLKSFVWRSHLEMSQNLLVTLANHHGSTLDCLYIDAVEPKRGMDDDPAFEKLTCLRSLRWNGFYLEDELRTVYKVIKSSAGTLENISIGLTDGSIARGEVCRNRKTPLEKLDRAIMLPALVEFQTPLEPRIFHSVGVGIPSSRIRRLYITDVVRGPYLPIVRLLDSTVIRLVELQLTYYDNLPAGIDQAIFRHGETLRSLCLCASVSCPSPETLSAEKLSEIGRRCPNLIELAISRPTNHPRSCRRHESCDCIPSLAAIKFPREAFANLRLLFISLQRKRVISTLEKDYFQTPTSVRRIQSALETMLTTSPSSPLKPSKLETIALGAAMPELYPFPRTQSRVRLWGALHTDRGAMRLDTVSVEDGIHLKNRWKILRPYALVVPNEQVLSLFRRMHFPPLSELVPIGGYISRQKESYQSGL